MYYCGINKLDIANGPGVRVTLFVSGCHIHCKGCHNLKAQDFSYGNIFTIETVKLLLDYLSPNFIEGFTLCGGEPFSVGNQEECAKLLKIIKKEYPDKSIWCFSGYYLEDIPETTFTKTLLENIDVLIEGPFILEKRDITDLNRWRGSTNQRVIDLKETLKTRKKIFLKDIPNNN